MPEQDTPPIDESNIPAQMLFRILPEEAINELAKSLLRDISNAPPPLFMQAGEELYTHGGVTIGLGDNYDIANITTSIEIGAEAVESVIDHMIGGSDIDTEPLGDKGDVIDTVGLFILSNVNGMSDLHNFACALFDEIGALAYYRGVGEIDIGSIGSHIDDVIESKIEKASAIKEKFYWQGVQKHINALLKSDKIANVKKAIETFNDIMEGQKEKVPTRIWVDEEPDHRYDQQVVDDVIEYLLNPIKFLRDNPDMTINLTAYEEQHGKLPRQPELPGLE